MNGIRGFLKRAADGRSPLHVFLSYGVAVFFLVYIVLTTPGKGHLPAASGTVLLAFVFYYTLLTRRVLETLILGAFAGCAMLHGRGIVDGFRSQLFTTMTDPDFAWFVLMCGFVNVFNRLLVRTGALGSFVRIFRRRVKDARHLNLATWLLQFPLFFDDYMTVAIGGTITAPLYDEYGVPREDGAFIIRSLAVPLRLVLPVTSWAAFLTAVFASSGMYSRSEALSAFIRSIPYGFYSFVAIGGTLLFALGILPKTGTIATPDSSAYEPIVLEEDPDGKKSGTLWDFFLPIGAVCAAAAYFDFDVVPAFLVMLPVTAVYYLLRGVILSSDIEDCLVDGFAGFMDLFILFCTIYMLNDILADLGYFDYLAGIVKAAVSPHLLPVTVFVVFGISECIMSLSWGLLLISFPVILPVAVKIGADPLLTAGAMLSATCFGANLCSICDYAIMTSAVFGVKADRHSADCVPYTLLFGVVSAVMYLAAGYIL